MSVLDISLYIVYNYNMKKIKRVAIREQIYAWVLEAIINGTFPAGQKLMDTELAKEYGISRTPVREALVRLEKEGYVTNHLNRGFEVTKIKKETILEIYDLVAELEAYALGQIPALAAKTTKALAKINNEFKKPGVNAFTLIQLDTRWHGLLVEQCRNSTLIQVIQSLKKKTFWFEIGYMKDMESIAASGSDHREILRLIKENKIAAAASLLKRNCLRTRISIENQKEH